jgi:hypothetical protein
MDASDGAHADGRDDDRGSVGVSCASVTMCVAVGTYSSGGVSYALAEGWNGSEWTLQSAAGVSGAKGSFLFGVSCPSTKVCEAVGEYEPSAGGTFSNLAEAWNGKEWAVQVTPEPGGGFEGLDGVSCTGTNACTAVGSTFTTPVVERWNGSAWSVEATPSAGGLYAVSCAAASACTAVGGTGTAALAEGWNGSEWSLQTAFNPVGAKQVIPRGLSCSSSAACTAVGDYQNSSGVWVPLAEDLRSGEWKEHAAPSPEGASASRLAGVSCTAPTACVAVGAYTGSSGTRGPLAESFGG